MENHRTRAPSAANGSEGDVATRPLLSGWGWVAEKGRGRGWARRRFAPRLAGGAGARAQVAGVLSPSRVAGTDVAASPRGRGAAGPRLRDPSGGKSDRPTSSYDPSSFANVVGRDAQDLTCAPF